MAGRLDGKVIIVAGGGGIGGGLARRYAAEGAVVLLGDIDEYSARSDAEAIMAAGGTAIGTLLDGADEDSVRAAVELAVSTYGGLDGFHANFANFADGKSGADALDLPLDIYDDVMRVNARGFLLCTRYAVPAMIERGSGSIVYTSSGAAHAGEVVRVAYAMSKAAVHALMRHVARRFGPEGIRANVIAPGVIRHAAFDAAISSDMAEEMRKRVPINSRLGEADDIAALGALLMSDEGGYISGQVLSVDGGATMRL